MAATERLDIKLNIDLTKIHIKHGCHGKVVLRRNQHFIYDNIANQTGWLDSLKFS